MFRNTINRLAHSPSIEEELVDYAKSIRQEEIKRQIGLIFVALALVVQSFAVLYPPESANAANTTEFIEGGFSTINDYLAHYDRDSRGIKSLFTSLGITREDIVNSRASTLGDAKNLLHWKMTSHGDSSDMPYDFINPDGTSKTIYYAPLQTLSSGIKENNKKIDTAAFVGNSSMGTFGILKQSGNLVTDVTLLDTCAQNPALPSGAPRAVNMSDLYTCNTGVITSLSTRNIRTGTQATLQEARASDRIVFTLSLKNTSNRTVLIPPSISITDPLEYAQLIDRGGASFNSDAGTLTWSSSVLHPGGVLQRHFIIRMLPVIPSTAIGQANNSSYDCTISSSFGSVARIPVDCSFQKTIELLIRQLPVTPLSVNIAFAFAISMLSAFFYARSKQLREELYSIRHNYHQGSI